MTTPLSKYVSPLPLTPASLPAMRRAMPMAPVRGCGTRALMHPCSVPRVVRLQIGRHGSTTFAAHDRQCQWHLSPSGNGGVAASVLRPPCQSPKEGWTQFQDHPRGGGGAPSPVADYHVGNASGNANGTRSRLWNEDVDASALRPPCRPLTKRTARFHDLTSAGTHRLQRKHPR